jgi:hypothetical protein
MHTTATPHGDRLPSKRIQIHAPVARTRRSHCLPHASTAPHPRACTSPAHTDRVNHLRPRTHSARLLYARPTPSTQVAILLRSPSLARIGSALRPSDHRRAHRDRLDARPASLPSMARRAALPPAIPPYRPEGTEVHTPANWPSTQRRHEHAAAPRARSGATPQHPHALATHACVCT